MFIKNTGTPIAIPHEGIGQVANDAVFQVEDELGARLLKLDRFVAAEDPNAEPEPVKAKSKPQADSAPHDTGG